MSRFICRASAVSQIMTLPRSKKDKEAGLLSETAKAVVIAKATQDLFGYYESINSKYLDKGLELEDSAIQAINLYRAVKLTKNTERRSNEWVTGECDLLTDDHIRDTKCSWSIGTFPWTDAQIAKEVKDKGYDWQMQTYMWLWDRPVAYVDYVLLPTPEHLLRFGDDPVNHIELVEQIPLQKRIKSYEVKRDDDAIEQIKKAVDRCQDYYKSVIEEIG